ncbi:hypothetical protein [Herbidospora sp. RD11066]
MRLDEVAAAIVAEVSPEEAEYFPAIARAVRRDPGRAFEPGTDDLLGFGIADIVTLASPIVLAVLSAAATDTLSNLLETMATGTAKKALGRFRRKKDPEIAAAETPVELTEEQKKDAARAAEEIALSMGADATFALRLRQALYAHLSGER